MSAWRICDAGDAALLLELEAAIDPVVNARAVAAAHAFRRTAPDGVRDVLSTYRSVAVHFDPLVADVATVRAALETAVASPVASTSGALLEVPVRYGGDEGPDLERVAAAAGMTAAQVVERHLRPVYRVFMLGFLPGFAYLGPVDPAIAAPRHATPRMRVPAGSVGIAGRQTGIYPIESPGGWQIIGRTTWALFDPARTPPARLSPGDTVRFVSDRRQPHQPDDAWAATATPPTTQRSDGPNGLHGACTILRPGLFTTVQDGGRWGFQGLGVPVAGALDAFAHDRANALVGNSAAAATLEVTVAGPELRLDARTALAVTGADLEPTLDDAPCPMNQAVPCRAGGVLRFGARRHGGRAYVALAGGIDTTPILGSRATHVRTGMGGLAGRTLQAGDRLPLGPASQPARSASAGPARSSRAQDRLPAGPVGARLRVIPGPQDDFFDDEAFELLERTRFVITPASDRMGYRLKAASPIPRTADREMISDATFPGGIQVPPSGDPILLLADRQTTGGYPQIAVVISADLPRAGQLLPGDWIELRICSRGEAVRALADAREQVRGFE